MNLIDAVKSGKRFRRDTSLRWLDHDDRETSYDLCSEDILANDWIVEEQAILLTASRIQKAWHDSTGPKELCSPDYIIPHTWYRFDNFLNKLGFK